MGRIKSTIIKRAAFELFTTTEGFNEDFERNKKILKDTMPSKKVRNKVAGQLSRLARQKRQKEHDREHRGKDIGTEQQGDEQSE
ncbi:30S ribosomal protein S17e [Candidatus Pacearchaeota archaeon]|nr:30S ribosomal protein S17e [Candidatus Pacearchaeota archaeon]